LHLYIYLCVRVHARGEGGGQYARIDAI
jgi:hypothetical protein